MGKLYHTNERLRMWCTRRWNSASWFRRDDGRNENEFASFWIQRFTPSKRTSRQCFLCRDSTTLSSQVSQIRVIRSKTHRKTVPEPTDLRLRAGCLTIVYDSVFCYEMAKRPHQGSRNSDSLFWNHIQKNISIRLYHCRLWGERLRTWRVTRIEEIRITHKTWEKQ